MANSKDDLLKDARNLLFSIQKQGQGAIVQDSRQAAEALHCCITLIESFHRSVLAGQGPFPSSPDWKVVNAVLGLLVRLGICPYLSPGVGIARETLAGNAGVLAAASAISEHLSGLATSDSPRFQKSDTHSTPGSHILFLCAEVLASLVWDECADVKRLTEIEVTAMSSLGQLVLHSYLWHMIAAYLQLACCPQAAKASEDGSFKQIARERIKSLVEMLPVRQVVEACFVLLHSSSPGPPVWLKSEVGKQLSKIIMRRGGVGVVLDELVGRATEGNVEMYDKVASHLAKTPKSIATVDEYFKAICPQILPLLLLRSKFDDPNEGETSRATLRSVHITAISLACKLFCSEPGLAVVYLLEPLLEPLLSWSTGPRELYNPNMDSTDATCEKKREGIQIEGDFLVPTEKQLVDSVVQLSVLLTAGHQASGLVKETILLKTKEIAPLLFKLHSHLEAVNGSSTSWASGSLCSKGKKSSQCKEATREDEHKPLSDRNIAGNGIAKGLLEKEIAVQGATEAAACQQSALCRLRFSLADFVMVHANQPLELALPTVLPLLFQPELSIPSWPEQGEIWDSLSSKTSQSSNSAKYLSCLLFAIENWPMAVAVLGELLQKVLYLRHSIISGQGNRAKELFGYMQYFEVLNNEVGSKALEQAPRGAVLLVKGLLGNKDIMMDEDLVELVLHMVNSVLKGFQSSKTSVQNSSSDQMDSIVLADMALALQRVCSNACLSEKVRQMSFTLAEECFFIRNISPSE